MPFRNPLRPPPRSRRPHPPPLRLGRAPQVRIPPRRRPVCFGVPGRARRSGAGRPRCQEKGETMHSSLSDKNRGNTCGLFSLRTQSALSLPPDHPSRVELLSELDPRCGRLAVRGRQNISREAEATAALEGSTGSLLNTPRLLPALSRPALSHSLSLQLDEGSSTNVRNFEV